MISWKTRACLKVKMCLGIDGPCFCCEEGHKGTFDCIHKGNPVCPDYVAGLCFDAEYLERLERNMMFN